VHALLFQSPSRNAQRGVWPHKTTRVTNLLSAIEGDSEGTSGGRKNLLDTQEGITELGGKEKAMLRIRLYLQKPKRRRTDTAPKTGETEGKVYQVFEKKGRLPRLGTAKRAAYESERKS